MASSLARPSLSGHCLGLRLGLVCVEPLPAAAGEADWARALGHLVQRHRLAGRAVMLSVPTQGVMLRRLQHPAGTTLEDVALRVHAEACAAMPWAAEDLISDFSVIDDPQSSEGLGLLMAATPSDRVQRWVRLVRDAGLRPAGLEVETHAAWRVWAHRSGLLAVGRAGPAVPPPSSVLQRACALAEWRTGRLRLRVFNGLDLHFEREMVLASPQGPADAQRKAAPAGEPVAEVVRWLQHFQAGAARVRLSEIWLAGSFWTEAHRASLEQATGWPVGAPDVLDGWAQGQELEPDPDACLEALGLALGGIGLHRAVDLLPHRAVGAAAIRRRWVGCAVAALLAPMAMGSALAAWIRASEQELSDRLLQRRQAEGTARIEADQATAEAAQTQAIRRRLARLIQLEQQAAEPVAALEVVSHAALGTVQLIRVVQDARQAQELRGAPVALGAPGPNSAPGPQSAPVAEPIPSMQARSGLHVAGRAMNPTAVLHFTDRLKAQGWMVRELSWSRAGATLESGGQAVAFDLKLMRGAPPSEAKP